MQQIHHKKNELLEIEFYQDKECTEAFDFTNAKNLYIDGLNGDCTPIFALSHKLSWLGIKARIFTPIWNLGWRDGISPQTPLVTLNDVLDGEESSNVNLSKYIPEDNAVLFLSEEEADKCANDCDAWFLYQKDFPKRELNSEMDIRDWKAITIFLPHGTQSEFQKANKVAKELKEKYGVLEVNVCVLHCFERYIDFSKCDYVCGLGFKNKWVINKIITTNSTGILPVDGNDRLQVIDAKEIFEEYLKENN
jgi:hypothetical protein